MDDYLNDETEGEGTEGALDSVDETDLQPYTVESVKQGELSPLELADMLRRSRVTSSQAATDLKKQIERARNVILSQPTKQSKADWLLGVGSTLLAPGPVGRAGTLGESLSSLGKYVSDVSQQERQAEAAKAQQLANFNLNAAKAQAAASKEDERALATMMSKYLSQKPAQEPSGVRMVKYYQDVLTSKDAKPEEKAFAKKWLDKQTYIAPQRDPADLIKSKMLEDALAVTGNPDAYTAEQVKAAQITVDRMTPPDVRKAAAAKEANAMSFKSRLEQTKDFVIPDIDRAIKIAEENPNLAAGITGNLVKNVPLVGQASKDLHHLLETIRANVGFEKLEELKRLSPSGASGLGAVSNAEQRLLQATKGSLEQDSSAKNLVFNLKRVKTFYTETLPQMMAAAGYDLGQAAPKQSLQEQAAAERKRREEAKKGG